ncbi:9f7ab7f4-127a-4445-a11b-67d6fcdbe74c [Thermothielavioides terrestris]|jgi:hypothetical protein|uniref:Cyclin-like domain-containing protein n=2 Tax=Thermothielavioides terrestris TaxID=2587410 RepID=G2RAT1_THETT|nr:uncharacterized protein THITE_2120491 [Thermothielavioides terrestris NRRL 8126]AEO69762.1 hypothetical protein THITE_2120491 [Thermothielavioides terrestris NRRL 8126]SPQ26304.1 9f7ab7f4-127a-4445-a11b-67d6fcdbe74c [Thermothielavioides terrestris]
MPQSDRRRPVLHERPLPNEQLLHPISRCTALPPHQPPQTRGSASAGYRPAAQPSSLHPEAGLAAAPEEYPQQREEANLRQPKQLTPATGSSPADGEQNTADAKMTHHSMSIPERISPRGGSISDFMADVAALFWFESTRLLEKVESAGPGTSIQAPAPAAVASQHFKKWVSSILNTTQVTQNVVILALLYIYRLKKANPTVKGRSGSEYRLLTVALMLGNKFLDDNTYTNKTWADVSCISVNEIHVMEVEFLSNMRYSLLVSAEEWEQWLDRLTRFWSYLELARHAVSPSPSPLLIPSPTHRNGVSPLQSPTVPLTPGLHSASQSCALQSPNLAPLANDARAWMPSYGGGSNAASPPALKTEHLPSRKRGFPDEASAEPPAKRLSQVPVGTGQSTGPLTSQSTLQHHATAVQALPGFPRSGAGPLQTRPTLAPDQGRQLVPTLTLNTAQAAELAIPQSQPLGPAGYTAPQAAALSLPPLASGVRAMSMVFPVTTYAPSQPTPATCGTSTTPTSNFPPMTFGTPTKRLSPQSALGAYPGSSPIVMATPMNGSGATSGLHTPISHSPSIYLQQRNSPYKPVRHVNTLLYPPPSAFLQRYHLPNPVLPNQMHYQPLGKRNEYRTGIVPEFLESVHRSGPAPSAPQYSIPQAPYQPPVSQMLPDPHPHPLTHQQRAPYQSRPQTQPALPYPGQY